MFSTEDVATAEATVEAGAPEDTILDRGLIPHSYEPHTLWFLYQ